MPKFILTVLLLALSFTLHAQQGKPVGTVTIEGDSGDGYDPAADTLSAGMPAPEQVYYYVDKMPSFPGGMDKYVRKNLRCPAEIKDADLILAFIVKKDGRLSEVKIARGAGTGCDDEAIKMLQNMPPWTPGLHKGQKALVSYVLKIHFEAGKLKVIE